MNMHGKQTEVTRKQIKDALIELLGETNFENITVARIADKAGLHRSTVYNHYSDVFSILNEIKEDQINYYSEALKINERNLSTMLPVMLRLVKRDQGLFLSYFKYSDTRLRNNELVKMSHSNNVSWLSENEAVTDPDMKQYIYEFRVRGAAAIILRWLENGCCDDIEKIADVILVCVGHKQ